jgi:hypothetical protein
MNPQEKQLLAKFNDSDSPASIGSLLFDILAQQNEKLDRLIDSEKETRDMLVNHMKGEDALIKSFKAAFPGDDPQSHRAYHEALIDQAKHRKEFWMKLTFELAKWGLIGFAGWAILQLWHGALKGPGT